MWQWHCNRKIDEGVCVMCKNATSLTITNITSGNVTLNWIVVANSVQWQVEYKQVSTGSKWTAISVSAFLRSIVISSHRANQGYQWLSGLNAEIHGLAFWMQGFNTLGSIKNAMAQENSLKTEQVEQTPSLLKL
jgi:hypothetical protein